jgi:hypothetical protein
MTFHPRSIPFTAGVVAELNEMSRMSRAGVRASTRVQAVRRDHAFPGELVSFQDPDGEAGRGRLGHAY